MVMVSDTVFNVTPADFSGHGLHCRAVGQLAARKPVQCNSVLEKKLA